MADVRTATLAPWTAFVDRFGVSTVVGLLSAILGICAVQNAGITLAANVAGAELLLSMIVVGCVGVLAYRSTD